MSLLTAALAVLLSVSADPAPIRADQTDPRLPPLFERLKATDSAIEGRAIEGLIWRIWMTSDDAEVARLMTAGVDAMAAQDHGAALRAFNRVVAIAPGFAEGWNKRATIHYLMGDYAASLRDVNRTLELEPRHFGALSGLALIRSALNQEEEALAAFEQALAVNPHMDTVRQTVEQLRRRIGGKEI